MASTKKERREKKRASRNKRELRKIVRYIRQVAKAKRLIITAKSGIFGDEQFRNWYQPIIRFSEGPKVSIKTEVRKPNKKEKYSEVRWCLYRMYISGAYGMSRSAYYTLKGMAKRNPDDICVLNFIAKRNEAEYNSLLEFFEEESPHVSAIMTTKVQAAQVVDCSFGIYNSMDNKIEGGDGDGKSNKEKEDCNEESEVPVQKE